MSNSGGQRASRMRSLSKDLTLTFVLVVSVISLLTTIISYSFLSHRSKVLFDQKSDEYIAYLKDSLELPLWRLDNDVIRKVCDSFAKNEAVALLRITDENGDVIYEELNKNETDVMRKSVPLSYENHEIGRLELGLTSRIYKERNNELLMTSAFMTLAVIIILSLTTRLILDRLLKRPLDQLIQRTKGIAAGEYVGEMPVSYYDEIDFILAEFNSMAEEIKKREQSLIKINEELEAEIAGHRLSDDALKKNREMLSILLQTIPDLVWLKNADGVYLACNARFEQFFGAKMEDIINKTDYDFVDKKLADFFREHDHKAMDAGGPSINEEWVVFADGHSELLETIKTPMFDTENRLIGVLGIGRNITDRKMAEEKLNESEIKYRTLFEKSADAVLIIEGDKFVDCNPATVKMLGYASKSELLETHPSQLSPPTQPDGRSSFEKANEMMSIAFEKGSHRFEWDHKRRNGEVFPVEVLLTAVPIGKIKFLHVVWRDITERKKMEEELLKAQKLESIGVLAGGIAHDFNNLLTAILNNLFLMKTHAKPEERLYDRICATVKAATRAQSLTQQLLTFSKGGKPIKRLIDIREIISESVSIALRGSNVKCEISIPDDVWHIEADAGQMNQVINNVLINADQSMPECGTIKILCENISVPDDNTLTLKEGNYIKLSIKDGGTGIPDEYLSRIFDPYFTTKQKGSGLGLSTTYSIIKKHDGHINVESEPGAGAVFYIYLPASMGKVHNKMPAEDELIPGTGKVLIMDDDELVRDSLGYLLINIGYVVEFAYDGREAISMYKEAMASEDPFSVVIMDLTIPGGMGGKEAVRELIKIDPHVKAIVSSGYSLDTIMSNYADYGFKAVLTKPYNDIRQLSRTLYDLIEGE